MKFAWEPRSCSTITFPGSGSTGEYAFPTISDRTGCNAERQLRGCVTPLQIRNLQSQVGPLEDLDLDLDLPGIIDGFDELDKESREKLKFALENGHVPDEDWKGVRNIASNATRVEAE